MAFFPKPARPRTAWDDIKSFTRGRGRHHWFALVGAIAMPTVILYLFWLDGRTNLEPGPPEIIYAESWPLTRTDAEIIERQRVLALEENERRAIRRAEFQRLAERLGVDYDRAEAARQEAVTRDNRERLARPAGDNAEAPPAAE